MELPAKGISLSLDEQNLTLLFNSFRLTQVANFPCSVGAVQVCTTFHHQKEILQVKTVEC